MHKIALFLPKTAAFHGLRFETKKNQTSINISKNKKFFRTTMGFAFYGGRRSLGIVYFFDKLHIATNINSSSIRLHNSGFARTLRNNFISKSFCAIFHKS